MILVQEMIMDKVITLTEIQKQIFEPGEIRAIIDNFSYASYIAPSIAKNIINVQKYASNI